MVEEERFWDGVGNGATGDGVAAFDNFFVPGSSCTIEHDEAYDIGWAVGGSALLALGLAHDDPSESTSIKSSRLTQDEEVNPVPPAALGTSRPIGLSATQNAQLQDDVGDLRLQGAEDVRVNQQQVNAAGVRVGINRPDLQYALNGKRYYVECDTDKSDRGLAHEERIMANDPHGIVELKRVN